MHYFETRNEWHVDLTRCSHSAPTHGIQSRLEALHESFKVDAVVAAALHVLVQMAMLVLRGQNLV